MCVKVRVCGWAGRILFLSSEKRVHVCVGGSGVGGGLGVYYHSPVKSGLWLTIRNDMLSNSDCDDV